LLPRQPCQASFRPATGLAATPVAKDGGLQVSARQHQKETMVSSMRKMMPAWRRRLISRLAADETDIKLFHKIVNISCQQKPDWTAAYQPRQHAVNYSQPC
jgi:hypothetical protein